MAQSTTPTRRVQFEVESDNSSFSIQQQQQRSQQYLRTRASRYDRCKEWFVDTVNDIATRIVSDRTNLVFYGGMAILCFMIIALFTIDTEQVDDLVQQQDPNSNGSESDYNNNNIGKNYDDDDDYTTTTSNNNQQHHHHYHHSAVMMGTTMEGKPLPETLLQPVPQNVNILIIGDSIARYGYLSLIYFLRWGRWFEPTLEKSNLVCEWSFQSPFHDNNFGEFYFQTNRMVQPYELCDCYRSKTDPHRYKHLENRYYHDPTLNNTVTFLHAYGHEMTIRGRIPANETYDIHKWDWHKQEQGLLKHEYKQPNWEYSNWADVITQYVAKMEPKQPDYIIVNAGQYSNQFGPLGRNAQVSKEFVDAIQQLSQPQQEQEQQEKEQEQQDDQQTNTTNSNSTSNNLSQTTTTTTRKFKGIWRTTTHGKGGDVLSNDQYQTDEYMCELMGIQNNCLNVSWTKDVVDFLYWDTNHFYEPVYRVMNEKLLEYLGYLPRGYQKLKRKKIMKGYVDDKQNDYIFHDKTITFEDEDN